jgi:hypothetical protein
MVFSTLGPLSFGLAVDGFCCWISLNVKKVIILGSFPFLLLIPLFESAGRRASVVKN